MFRQKSFWIIIFAVSIIAFMVGSIVAVTSLPAQYQRPSLLGDLITYLIVGFLCFAAVWICSTLCFTAYCGCYFVVRWIIKGFHNENKKETREVKRELK